MDNKNSYNSIKNYDHVISLGYACLGRIAIDKLRINKKYTVRMPFDGCCTPYEALCELLENDFQDYSNQIYFEDNKGNPNLPNVTHTKYNIVWAHEKNLNHDSLVIQLDKRVEQFKKILKSNESVLFFIHHHDTIYDLIDIILKKFPNLKFHIIVLYFPDNIEMKSEYCTSIHIEKTERMHYSPHRVLEFSPESDILVETFQNILYSNTRILSVIDNYDHNSSLQSGDYNFREVDFLYVPLNKPPYPGYPDPVSFVWINEILERPKINPCTLAQITLYLLHSYKINKKPFYLSKAEEIYDFNKQKTGYIDNNKLYFKYNFDFNLHGISTQKMKKGWISGMTQGDMLHVCSELIMLTKKEKYYNDAIKIFNTFLDINPVRRSHTEKVNNDTDIKYICNYDKDNCFWIEEYPMEVPCRTLNGFMFAIMGLYKYYLITKSYTVLKILTESVYTIEKNISHFINIEDDKESYYCLKNKKTSGYYHQIHIHQLNVLTEITGENIFKEWALKFEKKSIII